VHRRFISRFYGIDAKLGERRVMFLSVGSNDALHAALDEIGLGSAIEEGGSALVKINLARPPRPEHPRTDPMLLAEMIRYASRLGARCAIAEGADGFLMQNLEHVGLGGVVEEYGVQVVDLDLEGVDCVSVNGEEHYLPRRLKDYAVRIGMPATSKRPGMTFSSNVKLFVGVVPRRMYQKGETMHGRPRVHVDLHRSVANIYRAVMAYAPFGFFVNGGRAMFEGWGEIELPQILVGDDALELDRFVLKQFGIDPPEYVERAYCDQGSHL
jgi:uncharacterized protein (DUF362 family)